MYMIIIVSFAFLPNIFGQITTATSNMCAYTFYVPKKSGELQCPTQSSNNNYEKRIEILESIMQNQQQQLALLTKSQVNDESSQPTTTSEPSGKSNARVNYVRYGHKECPTTAKIIYSGYTGKSHYQYGGGVNYLCLPKDPEWPSNAASGHQKHSYIYGTEYEINNSPVAPSSVHDNDVPCTVCESLGKFQKLMIPGKKTCHSGWTLEYSGILMSQHHDQKSADFVCVDNAMQTINGGSADKNGGLLYAVEAVCGSLPCPPYNDGYEFSCVVCTK